MSALQLAKKFLHISLLIWALLPSVLFAQSLININTASLSELDTLHGIGPVKAQTIIDYRDQNGDFENIDDIKKVSGIGDATFEDIKSFITVTATVTGTNDHADSSEGEKEEDKIKKIASIRAKALHLSGILMSLSHREVSPSASTLVEEDNVEEEAQVEQINKELDSNVALVLNALEEVEIEAEEVEEKEETSRGWFYILKRFFFGL